MQTVVAQIPVLASTSVVLVQLVKLPAWEVGDRGFEPHSGLQVSKKQIVFPRAIVIIQYYGEPP